MFVFRFARALAALPMAVQAQEVTDVGALAVPGGAAQADARVSPLLLKAKGKINVWVQLQDPSLAARQADAKNSGLPLTRNEQRAWLAELHDKDDALSRVAVSLGGRELGRVSKSHNAVAFSVDASQLANLAAQPGVLAIRPVIDYQVASAPPGNPTAETIPSIGASAVQNGGISGRDVRVAVLDSGIDYTHADLGGPGPAEASVAA